MAVSGASPRVAHVEHQAAFLHGQMEDVGAAHAWQAEHVGVRQVGDGLGAVGLAQGRKAGRRLAFQHHLQQPVRQHVGEAIGHSSVFMMPSFIIQPSTAPLIGRSNPRHSRTAAGSHTTACSHMSQW